MKFIVKAAQPRELTTWFEEQPVENGKRINCRFDHMPSEVKRLVKQQLLDEQGYLCCYTGMRISEDRSHIEHLRPQSVYFEQHEDVDYANLLAAFPGYRQTCEYGAQAKDSWYDEQLLVSPLHKSCESRFFFAQSGKISALNNHEAATETIKRLRLDHPELTELRAQAIATILGDGKKLSDAKLERIIQTYCDRDSNTNTFRPFCFVIQQAAAEVKRKREKAKQRRKYIQQKKKQS